MYMDGLKYQNITLKFSLKGPVRTHHYLNTYIRFNMRNIIKLIVAWLEQHHEFERWDVKQKYKRNRC
jgi:hypothetical protein